jgi:thiamine pyrophosphokinase
MQNNITESAHWLLIGNGALLSDAKLLALAAHKRVMALDGAYALVQRTGLNIDVLLGDFDSIDPLDLEQADAAEEVTVVHAPDQDQTDLQKGIAYLDELAAKSITVCAATDGRLQHTLFNLRLLKRCYRIDRPLMLYTETEIIRYVHNGELRITGHINDSIGILGFPQASITTKGLQYEVMNYLLDFDGSSSVSNSLAHEEAVIQVTGDALVIHET